MLKRLQRARRASRLRRMRLPFREWNRISDKLPLLVGLTAVERARLRVYCTLFLQAKSLEPVGKLTIDGHDHVLLAIQACLPILNLGLDWYAGWSSVVIYPDDFVSRQPEIDETGVVHDRHEARSGESWDRGPVILALPNIREGGERDGYNVVIHEMAHKLDMLNGEPNGYPPLHKDMDPADWSRIFENAYRLFHQYYDSGAVLDIDAYAAESPAEFFAVFSEYFFELPHMLLRDFPEVYEQLKKFYRQDTARRLPP